MKLTHISVFMFLMLGTFVHTWPWRIPKQYLKIIQQCHCPPKCVWKLRSCLQTGKCELCRKPPYGKRQDSHMAAIESSDYRKQKTFEDIHMLALL